MQAFAVFIQVWADVYRVLDKNTVATLERGAEILKALCETTSLCRHNKQDHAHEERI